MGGEFFLGPSPDKYFRSILTILFWHPINDGFATFYEAVNKWSLKKSPLNQVKLPRVGR